MPNTTNVSFEGIEAESLLMALDLAGVAVSTGAACAAGGVEPSHVLRAMGLPPERVQGSLRFSLGRGTTRAEVDRAAEAVVAAGASQRQRRPTPAGQPRRDADGARSAPAERGRLRRRWAPARPRGSDERTSGPDSTWR